MPTVGAGYQDDGEPAADKLAHSGPVLWVKVGNLADDMEHVVDGVSVVTNAPIETEALRVQALIDTGARENHIDQRLADRLALPLVNKRWLSGASGKRLHNVYLASIEIPGFATFTGLCTAVNLRDGDIPFDVLLGRSMLRGVVMVYDGRRGSVTLSTDSPPEG